MKTILKVSVFLVLIASVLGEQGICSWYGKEAHGHLTASGEKFNRFAMTAAHKTLPFNSWVKVKCLGSSKSVRVRINDRGPFTPGRILDLSEGAAKRLKMISKGICKCSVSK